MQVFLNLYYEQYYTIMHALKVDIFNYIRIAFQGSKIYIHEHKPKNSFSIYRYINNSCTFLMEMRLICLYFGIYQIIMLPKFSP